MLRTLLLGALGVYWVALFVGTHIPQGVQGLDSINDKLLHFGAFAGLAFLLAATLTTLRLRHGALLLPLLIAAAYGGIDEVSQSAIPGRHAAVADWVADVFGAGLGVIAFCILSLTLVKCFTPRATSECKTVTESAA